MFTFSEHVLKICIAQLAQNVGWDSINSSTFEVLIDLCSKFILEFGQVSKSFANQCNRTQVNFSDLYFVFDCMGLNLEDLKDYLNKVPNIPFAGPLLPLYPVKNKKPKKINYPSSSECEDRKEFYQSWQPTLNTDNKKSDKFVFPKDFENKIQDLELVDYFENNLEQKLNLIKEEIEDKSLVDQLFINIKSKIEKLNINGFTDLTAKTTNYIYLSPDGEVLSYGGKQGRLPEAKKHKSLLKERKKEKLSNSDTSKKSIQKNIEDKKQKKKKTSQKFEAKPLNDNLLKIKVICNKGKHKKNKEKIFNSQLYYNSQTDWENCEYSANKSLDYKEINPNSDLNDKKNNLKQFDLIKKLSKKYNKVQIDKKTYFNSIKFDNNLIQEDNCEQIVKKLIYEMIANVDDKIRNKLDESFYDENEAAKTLVLLSYDSCSKNINSSNRTPEFILNEESTKNNIDYSFSKYNLDLNNNCSNLEDYNNNSLNNLNIKKNHLKSNEVQKFNSFLSKIKDKETNHEDDYIKSDTENDNSKIYSENSVDKELDILNQEYNGLPKLKLKFSLEQYKYDKLMNNLDKYSNINNYEAEKLNLDQKGKRKRVKKKLSPKDKFISQSFSHSKKKMKSNNKVWYCPTCSKPDDGTPMIGCDKCDDWYHWSCENIVEAPKEDKWFCKKCCHVNISNSKLTLKKNKHVVEFNENKNLKIQVKKKENKLTKSKKNKTSHSKKNQQWICPKCNKIDDGSPMIGCDKCDNWFHWICVGIYNSPKEDSWFCSACSIKKRKLK